MNISILDENSFFFSNLHPHYTGLDSVDVQKLMKEFVLAQEKRAAVLDIFYSPH